jgi:hypothetical protein
MDSTTIRPTSNKPSYLRVVDPATWFAAPPVPPIAPRLNDAHAASRLLDYQAAMLRFEAFDAPEGDVRAKALMRAGLLSDLAAYITAAALGDTEAARAAISHANAGHALMLWVQP